MASDSGSGFVKRNRPPRVQIQYEDPYDSEKMVELPFVMGVMSDLSGNNPGVEKEAVEERSFSDVTKDTLDEYMEAVKPGMTFTIEPMLNAGKAAVKLLPDEWTVVTKDHKLTAQWEHTILVTETGYEILTHREDDTIERVG